MLAKEVKGKWSHNDDHIRHIIVRKLSQQVSASTKEQVPKQKEKNPKEPVKKTEVEAKREKEIEESKEPEETSPAKVEDMKEPVHTKRKKQRDPQLDDDAVLQAAIEAYVFQHVALTLLVIQNATFPAASKEL